MPKGLSAPSAVYSLAALSRHPVQAAWSAEPLADQMQQRRRRQTDPDKAAVPQAGPQPQPAEVPHGPEQKAGTNQRFGAKAA